MKNQALFGIISNRCDLLIYNRNERKSNHTEHNNVCESLSWPECHYNNHNRARSVDCGRGLSAVNYNLHVLLD